MRGQRKAAIEHVQRHESADGLYFTVHDQHENVIATSRVFRNDAWFRIGLQLFMGASKAMILAVRPEEGKEYCCFSDQYRFIVDKRSDPNVYYFEFITTTGRTLLTSQDFHTHEAAMNAAHALQRIAAQMHV